MTASNPFIPHLGAWHASRLTNRSSQPLAVAMRTFDLMKQLSQFTTLAATSGGSASFSLDGLKWRRRRAVLRAMALDDRAT